MNSSAPPAARGAPPILLVRLPPWDPSLPPLGVAYLVAYLRSREMHADQYDLNKAMYEAAPSDIRFTWETGDYEFWLRGPAEKHYTAEIDAWAQRILEHPQPVIGFSSTFISLPFGNLIARAVKRLDPSRTIIFGGPGMAYRAYRDWTDRRAIDVMIARDGEFALAAVLENLELLRPGMDLPGMRVWKDDERAPAICVQGLADVPLADVPFPTFEEFDLARYSTKTLPVTASRGCVRLCAFCADTPMYKRFKRADPARVVEQLRFYHERYGVAEFRFNDLIINGDMKFLEALARGIIDAGLEIRWDAQGVARRHMTLEVCRLLKDSGCVALNFGMESFSDRVLASMRKGYEAWEGARTLQSVSGAGIHANINIIIGFPTETEDDFRETCRFIREHRAEITRVANINLCAIHPGTALFDHAADYGVDRGDPFDGYAWETRDQSNTLALRSDRLRRFLLFLDDIGLPYDCQERPPEAPMAEENPPVAGLAGAGTAAMNPKKTSPGLAGRLQRLRKRVDRW